MTAKRSALVSGISAVVFCMFSVTASAAGIFLYSSFNLHDYDQAIHDALGYQTGTITYLRELGSLTAEQAAMRRDFEKLGCFPFNVLLNGGVIESGFNCQTFFCVGYTKGPKVCKDREDRAFGGVVEISRRMQVVPVETVKKPFTSFDAADQTPYMKQRVAYLTEVRCEPYYLMLFDSAVGEGFICEEVGQYPYFSNANDCVSDWRIVGSFECTTPLRDDEFEQRKQAIDRRGGKSGSGVVDGSGATVVTGSGGSASSVSSFSFSSRPRVAVSFPDVLFGQYGYTAIMDLAGRRIVQGYDDGSFRPYATVNRAEFAKMLVGGLHREKLLQETGCFPDIRSEWFSSFVCTAKRMSWIMGYPDGRFHPGQTISKAEAMKIIIESLGVPLDSVAALPPGTPDGQWYTPYIRKAMELKLILEPAFNPDSAVVRADAAVWMYRSLRVSGR